MSRIRSIKPEFWTSEQVLECSTNARLLFLGLWNFCDDAGRHPYSAKQAKAEVFPADDFTEQDVLAMLDELCGNDLIARYSSGGKEYFYVTGWKHQRIDKPQPAKYPDPFAEDSKSVPRTLPPDTIGKDTKGREDTGSRAIAPRTDVDEFFENEFWPAYPKRKGSNPRKPARKAIEVAIKNGHSPAAIMAGLRRYIEILKSTNKLGTEFVKRAVSWIHEEGWSDHADVETSDTALVSKPVTPGTPEFEKLFSLVKPGSIQHTLMVRSKDTNQPFYPSPDLLANISQAGAN